jgi:hypothetical protein
MRDTIDGRIGVKVTKHAPSGAILEETNL